MSKITFNLNDKIEKDFRKKIAARKGLHKGVITESLTEAIKIWMKKKR